MVHFIHLQICLFNTGILLGTLTAELGGKVVINCEKTGYSAEIEFKLKVKYIFLISKVAALLESL